MTGARRKSRSRALPILMAALLLALAVSCEKADPRSAVIEERARFSVELISWAVIDPAVRFVDFSGAPCEHWAHSFTLLTGADAPAPLRGDCMTEQ